MITSKKELKEYFLADAKANCFEKMSWRNPIKRYLLRLRKTEYCFNTNKKIMYFLNRFFLSLLSNKFLTYIPINVCGKGLKLNHLGCIYINSHSRIGENCNILHNVTIGSSSNGAPIIGNNVTIFVGGLIIGDVNIGDNSIIGANCLIVKDVPPNSICLAPLANVTLNKQLDK